MQLLEWEILTLWLLVLSSIAQCEYKECMVNNFGNSVIWQWLQKCGWGNNVLKYGSFRLFWNHIVASWGYLERFAHVSMTKLNMVCNKLKNILRKLPPSYRYYGNSDATVSKSQNGQMQLVRCFCIAEHEDIWHNQQLNVEIILILCFLIYNWCKA